MDEKAYTSEDTYQPVTKFNKENLKTITLKEYEDSFNEFAEKDLEEIENIVPEHLPLKLPAGKIVYNPQTGAIFDSKFFPPQEIPNWEKYDWYTFFSIR